MYTETLKYIAENGTEGHTIFVDHNPSAPSSIIEQMSAFYRADIGSKDDKYNGMQ
jgi:hypothetical protein